MTKYKVGDVIKSRWQIYGIILGGFSSVYQVYDSKERSVFAIKTVGEDVGFFSPNAFPLIKKEANVWIDLGFHKNIARLHFIEEVERQLFIFLEYVDNGDLSAYIGKPLLLNNLGRVIDYAIQICCGMIYATNNGLLSHGDLKPKNILLTKDNIIKITDFGFSRVKKYLYDYSGGTLEYMAPELWGDWVDSNIKTDIYAFGALIYEMITGNPPFGKRPIITKDELRNCHEKKEIIPLTGDFYFLNELIMQCLEKSPEKRPVNFKQIRQELLDLYIKIIKIPYSDDDSCENSQTEDFISKGASLYGVKRYMEAIEAYEKAIYFKVSEKVAWSNMGVVYQDLKQYDEAMKSYNNALQIDPQYSTALANKGELLRILGEYDDSISCLNKAIQLDITNINAILSIGATFHAKGKYQEAIKQYDAVLCLDRNNSKAIINRAIAYRDLGKLSDSFDLLENAKENGAKDAELLLDLQKLALMLVASQEDISSKYGLAIAMMDMKNYELALKYFDEAIKENPLDSDIYVEKGICLGAINRSDEAFRCFDEAIKLNPNNKRAWFNKGTVSGRDKIYEKEIFCYEKAISIDDKYEKAWLGKALALNDIGRQGDALESYNHVIKINPKNAQSYLNRGLIYEKIGKYDKALSDYEVAADIDSSYQIAWFNRGGILYRTKRYAEAASCFKIATTLMPSDAEAWMLLGLSSGAIKNIKYAIICMDRAIEIQPNNGIIYYNKGIVLMENNMKDDAFIQFEKAKVLGFNGEIKNETLNKDQKNEKSLKEDLKKILFWKK